MGPVRIVGAVALASGSNEIGRVKVSPGAQVQILDASGAVVSEFGGTGGSGTEYTEGATDASITGTAILMEGAGNALVPVQGTAADGVLVNLGPNNDVTVTGTVTASLAAGTSNIGDVDVLSIAAGTNLIGGTYQGNGFVSTENIYVASVVASAAGASKNHLSLFNAGAALKVDILEAYVTKEMTAAVTGLTRGHRLFRFTSAHSLGATMAPLKLDTVMGNLDAGITARVGSTVSSVETTPLGVVGVNEEETGSGGGRMVLFSHKDYNRPITLNQNEGVTIQQDSTAGMGLVSAAIIFRVR